MFVNESVAPLTAIGGRQIKRSADKAKNPWHWAAFIWRLFLTLLALCRSKKGGLRFAKWHQSYHSSPFCFAS